MKIIELDLTGCEYQYDMHEKIKVAFNFPDWYGMNWDAFWDLLRSECDADKVIVKGEKSLPKELDNAVKIMHKVLDDTVAFRQKYNCAPFSYEVID